MNKELEKIARMYGGAKLKKHRKKRQNKLIKDLCVDYTKNSTLHGLRYITASGLTLLEKLFWLVTFLVSVGLCGYLIKNVYSKWTNSPVIVTVSEKLVSVDTVPFPSVTICPQIKSRAGKYNFGDMLNKFKENNNFNESQVDMLKDISLICNKAVVSNRNFTNASLLKNIMYVSPAIHYTFDSCYWQHSRISCQNLFEKVYTAEGVCFNMNGIAAHEMFRDTVQSDYRYSTRTLKSRGWSLETGYSASEKDAYPKRGNKNHASPDLEIFLRSRKSDSDPQCNGLKSGYEIYLHHPADYPQTSLYRYSAVNNQVTSLAVSVHHQKTSEQLVGYSPEVRQCYFLNDRYLRYFQNYTTKNCEAECLSNYTYEHCNCVGFYMPHNDSSELCAENKLKCMREAYDKMARRELVLEKESDGCSCRPACHSVEYDAEVLKTNFETENFKQRFAYFGWENYDKSYNISKIEIYFKKPLFMSTSRSELFGTTDFLANIGGLLGVFLGFSFLSLVEIFYFLTLRLGVALRRDIIEEKKITFGYKGGLQNHEKNKSVKLTKNRLKF